MSPASRLKSSRKSCSRWNSFLWGMSQESEAARTIRYKSFGKAAIRTILALLAKEKLGREPNHQYNHQQIRDAMLKDLQQQPSYIPRSKINDEPKEPASKSCGTLVNLDQSKDAMFVASQSLAIQVGSAYTHKDFPAKVWELVESNQEGVKLAHKPLFQPQQTIVVKAHEIQASMKASKAKCPKLLNQHQAIRHKVWGGKIQWPVMVCAPSQILQGQW